MPTTQSNGAFKLPTPIFVAELSINHLGMVNIAKAMITAAKNAGANMVKLKMKKVDGYYDNKLQDWRNFKFKDYRQSLELSLDDFHELDKHCQNLGIEWFSTIHDVESLEIISAFNPPLYKVASMDADNQALLKQVIKTCQEKDKPLVLSLGGKEHSFAKQIIDTIKKAEIDAIILHTVSIYPTPQGKSNIPYLAKLKSEFETPNSRIKIGYSGHEEGFAPSLLAAHYGAVMIERHFTLTRDYKIHHIDAALTPIEFSQMVSLINEMQLEENSMGRDMNENELIFLQQKKYN